MKDGKKSVLRIKDEVTGKYFVGTLDDYSKYIEAKNKELKEHPYMIMQELAEIKKQNAEILAGINLLLKANNQRLENERSAELGRALDGVRRISFYT